MSSPSRTKRSNRHIDIDLADSTSTQNKKPKPCKSPDKKLVQDSKIKLQKDKKPKKESKSKKESKKYSKKDSKKDSAASSISSYSLFGEDSPLANINNFQSIPLNHEKPYDLNHDLKFQRQLRLIQLSNAHLSNMAHPNFDISLNHDENDTRDDKDSSSSSSSNLNLDLDDIDLGMDLDLDDINFDFDLDIDSDLDSNTTANQISTSPFSEINTSDFLTAPPPPPPPLSSSFSSSSFSSSTNDKFNIAIPIVDEVKTGVSQVDNIIDQFKFLSNSPSTSSQSCSSTSDTDNIVIPSPESKSESSLDQKTKMQLLNLNLSQSDDIDDSNNLLSPSSSFNLLNLSNRNHQMKKKFQPQTQAQPENTTTTTSHNNPAPIMLTEFLNIEPSNQLQDHSQSTKQTFQYRHNNRSINFALTKESEMNRTCRQPYKRALNRLAIWSGKAQEMVLDRPVFSMDEFII